MRLDPLYIFIVDIHLPILIQIEESWRVLNTQRPGIDWMSLEHNQTLTDLSVLRNTCKHPKPLNRKSRKQRWIVGYYHTKALNLHQPIINLYCSLKFLQIPYFHKSWGQPTIPVTVDMRLKCSWRHVTSSRWILICDMLRAPAAWWSCTVRPWYRGDHSKKPRLEEGHSRLYFTLSGSILLHPSLLK